jgi:hypothetical protein
MVPWRAMSRIAGEWTSIKRTFKVVTPNHGDEVDRAGITGFPGMTLLPPARQLICGVRDLVAICCGVDDGGTSSLALYPLRPNVY